MKVNKTLKVYLQSQREWMNTTLGRVTGLYVAYLVAIYGPYVVGGGLVYDDWSVALLSKFNPGLINSMAKYWGGYADRPIADLYYALTSNLFHDIASLYILNVVVCWAVAIYIVFRVLYKRFGPQFAVPFLFLASLPSMASTVIFSPAMQSIGALSMLMWAASLWAIDKYVETRQTSHMAISFGMGSAILLTYESVFPLFFINLLWPYIITHKKTNILTTPRKYVQYIALPFMIVLAVYALYQRFVVALMYGDISKARIHSLPEFWASFQLSSFNGLYISTLGVVNMVTGGIARLFMNGGGRIKAVAVIALATGLCVAAVWVTRKIRPATTTYKLRYITFAGVGTIMAVIVMHTIASSPPTLVGYRNRAMTAVVIILALFGAVVWDRVLRRHKVLMVVAVIVTAGYINTFILQRNNYIAATSIRNEYVNSIVRAKGNIDDGDNSVIIALVPTYLDNNFNDETVFSDEVLDVRNAIRVKTGETATEAISLSPGRLKRGDIVLGDTGIMVRSISSKPIPYDNILFYDNETKAMTRFGQKADADVAVQKLVSHAPGGSRANDIDMRDNIHYWIMAY